MILYIIEILGYSAVLFLAYNLLLKNTKHIKTRRAALIIFPLVSILAPFAKNILPLKNNTFSEIVYLNEISVNNIKEISHNLGSSITANYANIFIAIYLLVVVIMTGLFAIKIIKIYKLKKNSIKRDGVYFTKQNHSPFSLFSDIFISDNYKNSEDNDVIIMHESAHIKQYHSLDILYFEILNIVFWFNPIFYRMKNETSVVHEYLADETVLDNGIEIKKYSDIILNFIHLTPMPIANNLNNSLIKNRFIMMTKSKNTKGLSLRISAVFILVLSILVFNSCINEIEKIKEEAIAETKPANTVEFNDLENVPEFEGGQDSLMNYIASSTTFPENAKAANVNAKVYVQFVIAKTGNVEQVKVLRTDTESDTESEEIKSLQEEAMRVISGLPKWTPGSINGENVNVSYVIPINFKLQ